jgi:hypothetical protein
MLYFPLPQLSDKSLNKLFDDLSKVPASESYCSHCGSLHLYSDAQLWLEDSEQFWTIALPYCQYCNPEIPQRRPIAA